MWCCGLPARRLKIMEQASVYALTSIYGQRVRPWFSMSDGGMQTILWGTGAGVAILGIDAALLYAYPPLGIAPIKLDRFVLLRGDAGEFPLVALRRK